ncbi:MAG: MMPL family transporter [Pseudomonadota bacterium]
MSIMTRLEQILFTFALIVIKRPWLSLWTAIGLVLALTIGMTRMYIDVTNESMFRPNDTSLKDYKAFQAQFGRDDAALAIIEAPSVFTKDFFTKLEKYHHDIENNVPYLDKVTSLYNVTSVSAQDDSVLIDQMRKVWPVDVENDEAFKQSILNNPLYKDLLINKDGTFTLMVIRANAFAVPEVSNTLRQNVTGWHDTFRSFLEGGKVETAAPAATATDEKGFDNFDEKAVTDASAAASKPLSTNQLERFVKEVKAITEEHQSDNFKIRLAGSPMISQQHADSIHADFLFLLPLSFLLVFVILLIMLRKIAAVLISMLIVFLTLLGTFGFMGWIGAPITPVIVAIPPLILTIGVSDAIHMLSMYYAKFEETKSSLEAVHYISKRSALAVVFTSLTTIAGFLSFTTADLKPVADFGLIVGFGITLALVLTLILVPAIVMIMPAPKSDTKIKTIKWQYLINIIINISLFGARNSRAIVGVSILVMLLCIPGLFKLRFSHDVLNWFEKDEPVRINTLAIDEQFQGSIPLEVIIDTKKKNGIYSPEFMGRLNEFAKYTESMNVPGIAMGQTTSIVDTLKQIHFVMNHEKPESVIPNNPDLIAQELLLFESSGASDVEQLIDNDFSKARVTVRLSWVDAVKYVPVREQIEKKANEIFKNDGSVQVTGAIDLLSRSLVGVMQSMGSSYAISTITIGLMMMLLLRSFRVGFIAMFPNFLPIMVTLAFMGWFGIPLDMFTILLGGIALGIAVDDTIHFFHNFGYYSRDLNMSTKDSIDATVRHSGPSMVFTSISMAFGFLIFIFSSVDPLLPFGILVAITIINALLAELMITPAILSLMDEYGILNTKKDKLDNASLSSS